MVTRRPPAAAHETGSQDERFMRHALEAARAAQGRVSPNPAVGAVIVREDQVLAVGHTQRPGLDHAEIDALRKLAFSAPGATMYTTLEPCNHVGRTGPCTEAIIRAQVVRVVVGATDPNPLVNGKGLARLRRAGIQVTRDVLATAFPCLRCGLG